MNELTDDSCDVCGFDASSWTREQMIGAIADARGYAEAALAELPVEHLSARPASDTWSSLEYVEHVRGVFRHNRLVCLQALASDPQPFSGPFPPGLAAEALVLNRFATVDGLDREATLNAAMFRVLEPGEWGRSAIVLEARWTLRFALTHILHELLHHCDDIRTLAAAFGSPRIAPLQPDHGPMG